MACALYTWRGNSVTATDASRPREKKQEKSSRDPERTVLSSGNHPRVESFRTPKAESPGNYTKSLNRESQAQPIRAVCTILAGHRALIGQLRVERAHSVTSRLCNALRV
jgi:hypothetical protein